MDVLEEFEMDHALSPLPPSSDVDGEQGAEGPPKCVSSAKGKTPAPKRPKSKVKKSLNKAMEGETVCVSVVQSAEKRKSELAEAAELPVKRKRGRPKKSQQPPAKGNAAGIPPEPILVSSDISNSSNIGSFIIINWFLFDVICLTCIHVDRQCL